MVERNVGRSVRNGFVVCEGRAVLGVVLLVPTASLAVWSSLNERLRGILSDPPSPGTEVPAIRDSSLSGSIVAIVLIQSDCAF